MDAEIYSASTSRPDYFIDRSRYYLSSDDNGYIIDTIKNKSSVGVVSKDHQTITLFQGKVEKVLFKDSDIPAQYIPEGKRRFASLAYNKEAATLVFTIQVMQDPEQKQNAAVHILSYNLRTNKTAIQTIQTKYWDAEELVFNMTGCGQEMRYVYSPVHGKASNF